MNSVDRVPYWIAGAVAQAESTYPVSSPYDGRVIAEVCVPTAEHVEKAVDAAVSVTGPARALSVHVRSTALDYIARRIADRAEELAQLITAENGKPVTFARAEVTRAIATFRWASEETRQLSGELQRMDVDEASAGRLGLIRRMPVGPVLAIAPFNFPLNLVAHKVAPAIAVGAPVIIKPADKTPLAALALGEILAECDLPPGMFSVLPLDGPATAELVRDPRLPVVSFTGSERVGWEIKRVAWDKRVILELGGNATVVVHEDWPDLQGAADRIALFGYCQGGQVCVSVQNVLVHRSIADTFIPLLTESVRNLRQGDPTDAAVQVGPVIDSGNADRIQAWVAEAVEAGAETLVAGERTGTTLAPTLLRGAPVGSKVRDEEIFGPVVHVDTYETFEEAIGMINSSRFGLQAGVYTTDIETAFLAHREIKVGGVLIGDVPTYRNDRMPYGGIKASGVGREGVRYAMEDYTDPRLLLLTGLPL